jgi:hypothetical protein
MPLVEVNLPAAEGEVPREVRAFLREAGRRIERFRIEAHVPGFVPSDYKHVYGVLRAVEEAELAPGRLFCEWGSGFGVVTGLAAMLGFDAFGIEVEGELVEEARRLADDFELAVEFVQGSFIPPGDEVLVEDLDGFSWLTTTADGAHDELGLGPDDFDLIFAYPWPDEQRAIGELFERHGRPGALLLSYQSTDEMSLHRKVTGRSHRR